MLLPFFKKLLYIRGFFFLVTIMFPNNTYNTNNKIASRIIYPPPFFLVHDLGVPFLDTFIPLLSFNLVDFSKD